jgi:hypothetical protein
LLGAAILGFPPVKRGVADAQFPAKVNTFEPSSCSLSTFTIYASENFVFFIGIGFKFSNSFGFPSAPGGLVDSNFKWLILGGA